MFTIVIDVTALQMHQDFLIESFSMQKKKKKFFQKMFILKFNTVIQVEPFL